MLAEITNISCELYIILPPTKLFPYEGMSKIIAYLHNKIANTFVAIKRQEEYF
jgi:hypothetical protein